MLLDMQTLFCDRQKITESAASTNTIAMNGILKEVSFGTPIPLLIQVVESFATLTSLKVAIQTASDEDFTTPVTLAETAAIEASKLKAGYRFPINYIPKGNLGYMRLYFTVAGTSATAGKIDAGIVAALDNSYQDM